MPARGRSGPNLPRASHLALALGLATVVLAVRGPYGQPLMYGALCWAYALTPHAERLLARSKNA